ncbi:MAG: hypothetical protein U9O64_00230 [Campylobacterota bacterium]|nr:hypothetical protein [Campylobacterota bacterium]
MKFLITKELSHNRLLNHLMLGVVIAIFLYLILDMVLHGFVFGLDIPTLTTTLYGNMDAFIEPILLDTLLLQVHIDLFMSLFALMIVGSIYIRLYAAKSLTKPLIHLLFILGLLSPLVILLAYFTNAMALYLWLGSFVLWHLLAMVMSLLIIKKLLLS